MTPNPFGCATKIRQRLFNFFFFFFVIATTDIASFQYANNSLTFQDFPDNIAIWILYTVTFVWRLYGRKSISFRFYTLKKKTKKFSLKNNKCPVKWTLLTLRKNFNILPNFMILPGIPRSNQILGLSYVFQNVFRAQKYPWKSCSLNYQFKKARIIRVCL